MALAVAHAWLADSDADGGRHQRSLIARAQNCLGLASSDQPDWLVTWSLRLHHMPDPMWARLDVQRLASALVEQQSLGAACYPQWRVITQAAAEKGIPDDEEPDPHGLGIGWAEGYGEEDDDTESTNAAPNFSQWVQQERPAVRRWLLRPARMQIAAMALHDLGLPNWADSQQLAQALGIGVSDLDWLARPAWQFAPRDQHGKSLAASHYRHRLTPKARGGLRLLEVPKQQLAAVQKKIHVQLLSRIPVHEAAHGFVTGRSVLTHAALHAGQPVVCTFDLRDFFHSITAAQIRALWRSLGYPAGIAAQLTALTTTVTPAGVRERLLEDASATRSQIKRLATPHLTQGAASSPALANLCAFHLDMRLSALAERFDARYSRYADDLVFSGPDSLRRHFASLRGWVRGIAQDEGFALHPDKTRRMPDHTRQRITGVVVNEKPNLSRADYDLLRAQLYRLAAQQDPASDELLATLRGRVAWACQLVSPSRQEKLKTLLSRIPRDDAPHKMVKPIFQ
ncbi:reverse transcriptase family protein [Diaphorobacter aerolatus]|uniref:RNA-directed DNA polymerase n=1 Tax=Diaphorobacter aerolatus TaxID=1288495 RepID=A0A7H0GFT2_9BURK|nr:reverse transcriptase family protein [Diaphorobacter aerolatus]QNP47148.1 RNA-directed DNA polymerase [Diaphorobacter aerolatus]